MVAGKSTLVDYRMDRGFSSRHRQCCSGLGFIHHLLSHKVLWLWQQSAKMWPCAVIVEGCEAAGVHGARKALEHPWPLWFQLCPWADIHHPGHRSWSNSLCSSQDSPALPMDWEMPHPVCGLMLLHSQSVWEEILKQQCLQSGSVPEFQGCLTSSPLHTLTQAWPLMTLLPSPNSWPKCSSSSEHTLILLYNTL